MHKYILRSLSLVVLFALGSICTYFYLIQNGFGIFNLLTPEVNSSLESYGFDEFMVGDKATGHFRSEYNNLGVVAVRFTNKNRDSKDVVDFRIKMEGANAWYYQAKYNTDQFLPGKLFPFGFPQIPNSGGKSFVYEIESNKGASGSGIFLDYKKPVYVSVYFFDKNAVVGSLKNSISFAVQKIANIIENKEDLVQVAIFYIPAFFLLVQLVVGIEKTSTLYILFFMGIIFDIFLVQKNSSFLILSLIFVWMLAKLKHKSNSIFTTYTTLVLLLLCLVSSSLNYVAYAEKTAVWFFVHIFYLVLERWLEIKRGVKSSIDLGFVKQLFVYAIEKNKIRINKIIPVLDATVAIFIFYLFFQSIILVKNGLNVYLEYFLSDIPGSFLAKFIFGIILIFIVYSFLLVMCFKKKTAKLFSILISSLLLFQATKIFVSNSTSFQYQPKIFSLSPQKTSEAWADITLMGKNFQDMPFIGKVFVSGLEQNSYIQSWSNEKVVFRTNPTYTKSGMVCLQTHSKGNSNCLPFEYNFGKK